MTLDLWLAFAVASAIVVIIPGPTVLMVVSHGLSYGRRAAWASTAGVIAGDFTAMTASILGLGALLSLSATLFTALKWLGAAYLIYLGIKMWRAPVAVANADDAALPPAKSYLRMFLHLYVVTALNPKTILFFVAFLPQFVNLSEPVLPQFIVLEATFITLGGLNAAFYALLSSAARTAVRSSRTQLWVNRTSGAVLMSMGILAARWRSAVT